MDAFELKKYLEKQTVVCLRRVLKGLGYKSISRFRKDKIVYYIIFHFTSRKIQRRWRGRYITDVDPITTEPIIYPCWNKHVGQARIYYNLDTVVKHIITNGPGTKDPMTRLEYTEHELEELEALYKYYKLSLRYSAKSLLNVMKDLEYYKKLKYDSERIDVIRDDIFTMFRASVYELMVWLKADVPNPEDPEEEDSDPEIDGEAFFIPLRGYHIREEGIIVLYNHVEENTARSALNKAIHVIQESYTHFRWLYELSEHWFDATFKALHSRLEEIKTKVKDPDGIIKKFGEYLDHIRLLSGSVRLDRRVSRAL